MSYSTPPSSTPPPPPSSGKALGALVGAVVVVALAVVAAVGGSPAETTRPHPKDEAAVELTITSTPSGAAVYVGTRQIGQTPMDVTLPPDMPSYQVTLKANGHRDQLLQLRRGHAAHAVLTPQNPAQKTMPSPKSEDR